MDTDGIKMAAYMTTFSGKNRLKDARALRAIFQDAGYTDAGVLAALGVENSSSLRGSDTAVLLHRIEEETPLNTMIRLFSMELPVPADQVAKAIKPMTLETLLAWGLVTDGEAVTAAIKILPFQEFLIGFDPDSRIFSAPAPDYVMGIGSSSLTLANLTVQRKTGLTLDLGCGCGIQALLASRHSDKVLAVDNN